MKIKIILYIIGLLIIVSTSACKKYLDTKPDNTYATISTLSDVRSLLNNVRYINAAYLPGNGEFSSDNFYLDTGFYNLIKIYDIGNVYVWGKYPFLDDSDGGEWGRAYSGIMLFNTVLNALEKGQISGAKQADIDGLKGMAFAYRGYYFWKLVTTYSKAYNANSAATDLGIPLRLDISITEKLKRANIQQTYDQIITDLNTALQLLPVLPANITQPSKSSVNAMLSEVYLSMRNYQQAWNYADASLQLKHELIDYNLLDASSATPLPIYKDNKEILLWFSEYNGVSGLIPDPADVDTTLYTSYNNNDLRKRYFFSPRQDGTYYFSGNYSGGILGLFSGPTTAEMYLTRAECFARQGKTAEAIQDLNILMKNRIVNTPTNPFIPYSASTSQEALTKVLLERRKELIFRDLRWTDIKRLNLDGANIVLTRNVDGHLISLPPNDNRYAIQLPLSVIQLSGMEQNPY